VLGSPVSETGRRADELRYSIRQRAPCFTGTEPWNQQRIGAAVLYCSDGRWGEAFDEFCRRRLLIPRYDRWALPGGPVCLLPRVPQDGFCRGVWERLDFLVRAHGLRRVVLIAHYGCAYYTDLLGEDPDDRLPDQLDDLQAAARALRAWFPGIDVESYFAMRREPRLSFHEVGT
jgi:hypothetical protein